MQQTRDTGTVQCSGILLTPLLILTANHCVTGTKDRNGFARSPGLFEPNDTEPPSVLTGAPREGLIDVVAVATSPSTRINDRLTLQDQRDVPDDFALVRIDEKDLLTSFAELPDLSRIVWHSLLEIHSARPSFSVPPGTAGEFDEYTFDSPFPEYAGWDATAFGDGERRIASLSGARHLDGFWGALSDFREASKTPLVQGGDSGGPLFRLHADGVTRDPFGVISGTSALADEAGIHNLYTDIARADAAQWIGDNARDTRRSARWRSQHGKSDIWYGEVDYTGACDTRRDSDCDHWYTWHDNCLGVFNPDQFDDDDDGIGNACDGCPAVDSAGVGNCNGISELVNTPGQSLVPDVCDPVPCPRSAIDPTSSRIDDCARHLDGTTTCVSRVIRNFVTTTAIGSHDMQGNETIVANVTTSARFCQSCLDPVRCSPVINCFAEAAIKDARLDDPEAPSDPSRPWHRVTFGIPPRTALRPERGATFVWDYGRTTETNEWFFKDDYAFWRSQSLIQVPDASECEQSGAVAGTCLGGVFWLHADTNVGAAEHGEQLANHHFGWAPDEAKFYCLEPRGLIVPGGAPVRTGQSVTDAALGELLLPSTTTDRSFDINALPESELVLASKRGVLDALQHDGSLIALTADGSGCSGSAFAKPISDAVLTRRWRSAVEPSGRDSRLSRLFSIALADDATSILEGLADEEGVKLASDTLSFRGLFDPHIESGTPPAARYGFAAVYSQVAGGVFVVGGDAASGPLRDAWFKAVEGPWVQLSLTPETLGDVSDITYAFGDRQLWVLDETDDPTVPPRERRRVRLMRADPGGGGATRVFYVPRLRPHLRSFLSVDRDGSVLLALADATRFSLLRLRERDGKMTIGRLHSEEGNLVRRPIVDPNGYSFVLQASDGTLRVLRRRELVPAACDDGSTTPAQPRADAPRPCDANTLAQLF